MFSFGSPSSEPMRLLVHSAKQVVQVTSENEKVLKGPEMRNLKVLNAKPGDGLSIIVSRLFFSNTFIVNMIFDNLRRKTSKIPHVIYLQTIYVSCVAARFCGVSLQQLKLLVVAMKKIF